MASEYLLAVRSSCAALSGLAILALTLFLPSSASAGPASSTPAQPAMRALANSARTAARVSLSLWVHIALDPQSLNSATLTKPIFFMWLRCAAASTFATTSYLARLSGRR